MATTWATFLFSGIGFAQGFKTDKERVHAVAAQTEVYEAERQEAQRLFQNASRGSATQLPFAIDEIQGMVNGVPVIHRTDNQNAGISVNTIPVNSSPFNANGLGYTVGMWDEMIRVSNQEGGGNILSTHVELSGRVTAVEKESFPSSHATHVAGTLAAAGVRSSARGMANRARIRSFDWNNFVAEYTAEGSATGSDGKLLVSNSSFGTRAGWEGSEYYGDWEKDAGTATKFGSYQSTARRIDETIANTPYHLIFMSAGNDRDDPGPQEGATVTYFSNGAQMTATYNSAIHPGTDAVLGGYDTMGAYACAKNVMAVGAVSDAVDGGARDPSRATSSRFTGWGPVDDGRIKPDIVANGQGLLSCISTGNEKYATYSGTSMSTPNASGSALLLQEIYDDQFGRHMPASTLKGLIIHTADDIGRPGPDYIYGWGLMNTHAAAELILEDKRNTNIDLIQNLFLADGQRQTLSFQKASPGPLRATICWTDLPGSTSLADDNRSPDLVHDLDLRIRSANGALSLPFRLSWAAPTANATRGDNSIDNVEQVLLENAPAGNYEIIISHKGSLTEGGQTVSLIVSGLVEGAPAPALDITSPLSANGTVDKAFVYQSTATGNPTSWSYTGTLSPGLSLNSSTGRISGTPTQQGTTTISLQASRGVEFVNQNVTFTIAPKLQAPVITSPGVWTGRIGDPFEYRILASDNPSAFAAVGTLPPGLQFNLNGTISGVPNQAGTWTVTIRAANTAGNGARTLVIQINGRAPAITSNESASGRVGQSFIYQGSANWSPTSWSYTGPLPPGLTLQTSTGRITGIPTEDGSWTFELRARNQWGTGILSVTMTMQGAVPIPKITSATTRSGRVGSSFSYKITSSVSSSSFAVFGTLPPGLTFNDVDQISGTPTTAGQWTVTLRASSQGKSGSQSLRLTIQDRLPEITSPSSASGVEGSAFSYQSTARYNPSSWAVDGDLPPGLSINSSGRIAGTPTAAGNWTFQILAGNSAGTVGRNVTITIAPLVVAPDITSTTSRIGTVGVAFEYQITANNEPTSYSVIGTLPSGISLNQNTGLISGTPTQATTARVEIRATNSAGTGKRSLTITIRPKRPVITSANTASGAVGEAFSYQGTATENPTAWRISTGNIPEGLSLNTLNGEISGTPTLAGTWQFNLVASNISGPGSRTITITILPKDNIPDITSARSHNWTRGRYSYYRITATENPTSFETTPLPANLRLSGPYIFGTPTVAGTWNIRVNAINEYGTGGEVITLKVTEVAPSISPTILKSGKVGEKLSHIIRYSGSPGTVRRISGGLPPGLTLAGQVISGTPTRAATYVINVQITNDAGTTQQRITLRIDPSSDATFRRIPLHQTFDAASLPTPGTGWTFNSTAGGIQEIFEDSLFQFSVSDTAFSRNEAILHLNLLNERQAHLSFRFRNNYDEGHVMPESFNGSVDADGVAISVDGTQWHRIVNLAWRPQNVWEDYYIDLIAEAQRIGLTLGSTVFVKFQQYDNLWRNSDGAQWDSIRVTREDQQVTPLKIVPGTPYRQFFSTLPTRDQGWTYESTRGQGRIEISSERRLRMDTTSDTSLNRNRAILHLDLEDVDRAVLSFYHRNGGETLHELPPNASSGDGVAISVDGVNYFPLGTLRAGSRGWIWETFDLSTAFEEHGLEFTNHVYIALQQWDQRSYPDGGREFESLSVQTFDSSL